MQIMGQLGIFVIWASLDCRGGACPLLLDYRIETGARELSKTLAKEQKRFRLTENVLGGLAGLVMMAAGALADDLAGLIERAEGGDAAAQVELGLVYEAGEQVQQDDKSAFMWIERAAKAGNAEGQFYLGWLYANGYGVETDKLNAFLWFERAARQGHVDAKDQRKLVLPDLTPAQLSEARALLGNVDTSDLDRKKAEEEEIAKVGAEIGWDYADLRRAYNQRRYDVVPVLTRLARNGVGEAQNLVGYHLKRLAQVNPEDETLSREAFRWFLEAARQGYPAAQYNLGLCYLEGVGIDRNAANANRWFTMARNNLAREKLPSYQEATEEFREASEYADRYKAAMQGYASASRELRELVELGLQESKARRSIE
ncbi:TPR repeat protein [Aestuariispira insulae]|uniref:TPR repeat protein n=2 Tax=Aestuariispira insulae TaxID=1461337 RepID=A0A3D9HWT2_9PROT|nr:TPR repeat protein [Aestuariispira insulae]